MPGQNEMILYTHLLQQSLLHSIQFMKSSSVIFSKQIGQSVLGIVGVFGMVCGAGGEIHDNFLEWLINLINNSKIKSIF